jgi:hypothetical protein
MRVTNALDVDSYASGGHLMLELGGDGGAVAVLGCVQVLDLHDLASSPTSSTSP